MRLTLSTAAALAALTLNAQAADLDRELGLIVSGVDRQVGWRTVHRQ
jgi:hypothetical protein